MEEPQHVRGEIAAHILSIKGIREHGFEIA
jgi:hypothetical protein